METLLTAILAVAGIIFLAFLGVKLYNFFISQDERNEQAFIDSLKGKIENLEDGEGGNFLLQGLEERILVGWSSRAPGKPEKCFFDSCLCIVNKKYLEKKDLLSAVQDEGFCRKMNKENVTVNSSIGFSYNAGGSSAVSDFNYVSKILHAECIIMNNQIAEFKVLKNKEEIIVTIDYSFQSFETEIFRRSADIQKQKDNAMAILRKCRNTIN